MKEKKLPLVLPGDVNKVTSFLTTPLNAIWIISFFPGVPWKLTCLSFRIVADATVATRYAIIDYYVQGERVASLSTLGSVAASETADFTMAIDLPLNYAGSSKQLCLPDIVLPADSYVKVTFISGQAGDTLSFMGALQVAC